MSTFSNIITEFGIQLNPYFFPLLSLIGTNYLINLMNVQWKNFVHVINLTMSLNRKLFNVHNYNYICLSKFRNCCNTFQMPVWAAKELRKLYNNYFA